MVIYGYVNIRFIFKTLAYVKEHLAKWNLCYLPVRIHLHVTVIFMYLCISANLHMYVICKDCSCMKFMNLNKNTLFGVQIRMKYYRYTYYTTFWWVNNIYQILKYLSKGRKIILVCVIIIEISKTIKQLAKSCLLVFFKNIL